MTEPTGYAPLSTGEENYGVTVVTDETTTIYEIFDEDGDAVAHGVARRRKGERRNDLIGTTLAASRAYHMLALRYRAAAEELLS